MINKNAKQEIDDFSTPQREYSDTELQDFHNKIQRFWSEPREVTLDKGLSGTARKFNHEALHVAYGACRKVPYTNGTYVYQYNSERYQQFNVLWNQYRDWRTKQDWIAEKQGEQLQAMAEVPF